MHIVQQPNVSIDFSSHDSLVSIHLIFCGFSEYTHFKTWIKLQEVNRTRDGETYRDPETNDGYKCRKYRGHQTGQEIWESIKIQKVIELEFIKPESKSEMVKRDMRWSIANTPRPKRIGREYSREFVSRLRPIFNQKGKKLLNW